MLPLLYEDADVWVVNKPSAMPSVHLQDSAQLSVADIMMERSPNLAAVGSPQDCGVVHRLDNHTTGCLIVAKTATAYAHLRAQFDQRRIEKTYTALVLGQPATSGHISIPIAHMPRRATRMCCSPTTGQPADTQWTLVHQYPISELGAAGYALLDIRISTGVRHQIRVHMAHLGHPLAGDTLYQSRRMRDCDRLKLPHYLLHAHQIAFESPSTGMRIECSATLPELFQASLKRLDENKKRR